MNRLFVIRLLVFVMLLSADLKAQINIVNIPFQPFNVTPEALLNVNIMNAEGEKQVQILTQLYGSNNMVLMAVKSQPFKLIQGLNSSISGNRIVASVEFDNSTQASYMKTTHTLPSGRYKVCSTLIDNNDSYKVDDFCEDIEADFNQNLYLVNPFDGDTLDSKYPILSWMHSEPFSILNQGESYRIVVTEIKQSQSAEEAVTINTPVMVKNPVQEHQVQYPYDAKELKAGGQYAWQVQKLSGGVVINKTEAWKFYIRISDELKVSKYVSLKDQLDGSFYTAYDGIVYFKFFEEYKSQGQLSYRLTNDRLQPIEVAVTKDAKTGKDENNAVSAVELKIHGNNLYSIDLNNKRLRSGFYTLEVKNEKNESFYLKIFLP